jgi:hypothetical protein
MKHSVSIFYVSNLFGDAVMVNAMAIQGNPSRPHISTAPSPPKSWASVKKLPAAGDWMAAAQREMNMITTRKTWTTINTADVEKGHDVLPTKWVFTYRTDSDGYIQGLRPDWLFVAISRQPISRMQISMHTPLLLVISASWSLLLQRIAGLSVNWTLLTPSCSHISLMTKSST